MREATRETVSQVIRLLEAGKSPKEIAYRLGPRLSWEALRKIMNRNYDVRVVFVDTYRLRHPRRAAPPQKILRPLKSIVPNQ